MQKKIGGYIAIAVVITVAMVIFSGFDSTPESNVSFHVRLADPSMYNDGVYTDLFSVESGQYSFRFTPNGDSPQTLSITITQVGFEKQILFSEDFLLKGTEQGTESARYYSWDYLGQKQVSFSEDKEVSIIIDPHGNIRGPVSVELIS